MASPAARPTRLGARAIYLTTNGVDYGYRIHGTPEWQSIGRNASSGCIRMINQDVMDLYDRIPEGAKVIVLNADGSYPTKLTLPPPAPKKVVKAKPVTAKPARAGRTRDHAQPLGPAIMGPTAAPPGVTTPTVQRPRSQHPTVTAPAVTAPTCGNPGSHPAHAAGTHAANRHGPRSHGADAQCHANGSTDPADGHVRRLIPFA